MVYWDIIRFSFLRFFSYPFEILAQTLKRVIELIFLILFWSIYARNSTQEISIPQISAYFLIALGVAELTMSRWGAFSSLIANQVKSGQISNFMVKPVDLVWTLYSISVGRNGLRFILAIINIVIGIIIYPPKNFISVVLFFIFLILSWFISFAYNVLEGSLALHFTEAGGIRNTLQNFIRIITGSMVPLYLFPLGLQQILRFTPFPSMIYGPTVAFNISSVDRSVILNIAIALFWAIALNLAAKYWWQYSMKKYEAVGI